MRKVQDEDKVVRKTENPNTILTLKEDFISLGLKKGEMILMHSAMSKLGWTVGGPISVIEAIMEVLTPEGTLIMPTFSSDNTDPSNWHNPPVPKKWWPIIRKNMPAFDPQITPTRNLGVIPEAFRNYLSVIRSSHPSCSFAAWGKHKHEIIDNHKLDSAFGEDSPLARIYDFNGKILLLGVTHANNSSLHLAEYRIKSVKKIYEGSSIFIDGKRKWVDYEDIDHDSGDFEEIGSNYEKIINYIPGKVGLAEARLLSQRDIVDYAVKWMNKNRNS